MLTVLIQMSLIIGCGSLWNIVAPSHSTGKIHRRVLTDLVFYLLLPALVLDVIWQAPIDESSLQISLVAASGVAAGLIAMWLLLQPFNVTKKQTGALLLAAAFPNATYLGLPVLDHVLGSYTRATVLQYDLFACTPILLSLGMLLAHYYGDSKVENHPLQELMKVPPLWAVALGLTLNLTGVNQPEILHESLSTLASGVVPLMLIVLGMSIRWQSLHLSNMKLLLPVVLTSLILVPSAVFTMSHVVSLDTDLTVIATLLSAMPTMIFGVVMCEHYQLDSELYAAAVTSTTIVSLITLSFWFSWL